MPKAGRGQGHKPTLPSGGAALAPRPGRPPQWRSEGQSTCQLGLLPASQPGGRVAPSGRGTWPEEDWDLGMLSEQINSLPIPQRECKNKTSKIPLAIEWPLAEVSFSFSFLSKSERARSARGAELKDTWGAFQGAGGAGKLGLQRIREPRSQAPHCPPAGCCSAEGPQLTPRVHPKVILCVPGSLPPAPVPLLPP